MIIFRNFIKSIIIVAFPVFVAINAYFFLIYIDPSFNFLGADLTHFYGTQIELLNRCPNGGVSYFGFTSLIYFVERLPTDNVFSIIRGLFNSFQVANFLPLNTVPDFTRATQDASILELLQGIYYIVSLVFMPLVAVGWLGYAVYLLASDIVGIIDMFLMAFGGAYNVAECYTYPQTILSVLYYFGI